MEQLLLRFLWDGLEYSESLAQSLNSLGTAFTLGPVKYYVSKKMATEWCFNFQILFFCKYLAITIFALFEMVQK